MPASNEVVYSVQSYRGTAHKETKRERREEKKRKEKGTIPSAGVNAKGERCITS